MANSKYVILEESGQTKGHIKTYFVDAVADIAELPKDTPIGSTCLVQATSEVYILTNAGQWKPL